MKVTELFDRQFVFEGGAKEALGQSISDGT